MKIVKYLIYFAIFFYIRISFGQSGWIQQFFVPNYETWSVFFINAQTGFCAG